MTVSGAWKAEIRIRRSTEHAAERLAEVLAPEATREVPRATARLGRPTPVTVAVLIDTADTGSLRAALNTFLGWIELAAATEQVAERSLGPADP